ncbi:cytochrome b-245 chaperone 1 isoform 3-T5 [Megaptera novaeangliae]
MYMQVETRTSSYLHLKRAPGIRSWSLLVGILSIGLAAAYYSGDSLGWKLFYVTGCLFVAVQNLEDWEEAVFNKSTGKVVLKTFSLYRKLLTLCRAGHDQVVVLLSDIRDVNVEEEKVRYFGKGYVVVLRFATGFSHPLTQSAVMGHRSTSGTITHPSSWCRSGPVTWKPSPSSSLLSWSCTALRVPWSCLRAVTVRSMASGTRADLHGTPALVLVGPQQD